MSALPPIAGIWWCIELEIKSHPPKRTRPPAGELPEAASLTPCYARETQTARELNKLTLSCPGSTLVAELGQARVRMASMMVRRGNKLTQRYNPNSLWRNGSRAFFKDQRAHQIGDILTVKVNITDKANIANETQRSRTNSEDSGVTDFLGKQKLPIMNTVLPTRIFTSDSTSSTDGKGSVNRQEALSTNVAGVVTQVLPNGNMVVEGKQEIRVNFEVRELIVAGVVRPEDIESDNTIDSSKIAQARIAYGGRGQITDVQQPRYGQQVLDVVLPF